MIVARPDGDDLNVDQFCADNGIDEEATNQLKELEIDMQREVLGRGPLSDARNPSAVLLSRIRQLRTGGAKRRGGSGRDRDHWNRRIADFVRDNDLDDRANTCLQESDEDVLQELFRRPLTDARNPSAVVLSRIRQIKDDLSRGNGRDRRDRDRSPRGRDEGKGYGDDKGKGKGKGDDWWWYMPPWAFWGAKGAWDWGKGDSWDSWGKDGKGKGSWDEGKGQLALTYGKGGDGKGRAAPY